MEVIIRPDSAQATRLAAQLLAQRLRAKPDLVLGLATGRTMECLYSELVEQHREHGLDFSRCHSFNLDEYREIDSLETQLLNKLSKDFKNIQVISLNKLIKDINRLWN